MPCVKTAKILFMLTNENISKNKTIEIPYNNTIKFHNEEYNSIITEATSLQLHHYMEKCYFLDAAFVYTTQQAS